MCYLILYILLLNYMLQLLNLILNFELLLLVLIWWSAVGIVFYVARTDGGHCFNQRQFNFILFCGGPLVWVFRYSGKTINWILKKLE